MRALFAAAGIDYAQWKALTVVALKLDFRQMSFGRSNWGQDVKGASVLVGQIIFYLLFGLFMGVAVWFVPDLFLAGTMLISVLLFVIGTTILLEHNSALTSPLDYPVLGFRPVSSRTYFAARLTNVLVYTSALTTLVAWMPIAALFIRYGPLMGLAGIGAVYVCATSIALAVLLTYATMLRWFGADALKRALSYVQLAMSFMVYGGYAVFATFVEASALRNMTLEKTPLVLLYPGTWYASYLELAAGRLGPAEWVPALLTLALLGAMAAGLGGRLSLDYSERLGMLTASSSPRAPRRRATTSRWFRSDEGRAMALLVGSQFRNDQRFRMAVLSILPLTLLYVFMGLRQGSLVDPFDADARRGLSLVSVAVLLFPSMLKMAVTRTDAYRASWIFFACPTDRMKLVRATLHVLAAYFLLPYLVFMVGVYLFFVPNLLHILLHLAFLGLLSFVCLQVATFLDPDLPFSQPPMKGRATTTTFVLIVVVFGVMAVFDRLSAFMYQRWWLTTLGFAAALIAMLLLDRLTRARVDRQTRALEFAG